MKAEVGGVWSSIIDYLGSGEQKCITYKVFITLSSYSICLGYPVVPFGFVFLV